MSFIANLNGFVQPFGIVPKTIAAPFARSCSTVAWFRLVNARANPSFTDWHEVMVNDAASNKMICFITSLLLLRAVSASNESKMSDGGPARNHLAERWRGESVRCF